MNAEESYLQGKKEGYGRGYRHGYRYGRSLRIMQEIPESREIRFDLHVVFIEEGLFAVNEGIIHGLTGLVRQVTRVAPTSCTPEQIISLRPDVVLVLNGLHAFPPEIASAIRSSGIPVAVWFADDPYFTDVSARIALHYSYIFTHELSCVAFYRSMGCPQVHYLPLAASRQTFQPRHVPYEYRSDVCFIGTAFWNRVWFFDKLLPMLRGRKLFLSGGLWNRLQLYPEYAESIHLEGTPLEETVNYYNGAKIVINLHRSHDNGEHNRNSQEIPALSVNPRTFEIAACGALQMTDVRSDLHQFYTPGHEMETYASPEELAFKINHYLNNEEQGEAIAMRGLERTLREHTYRHRLTSMLQIIGNGGAQL